MDGLKMAQQHPLSAAVMAKGLFGALSAAGATMDPRSLAMAAAFLHQGPVNLAGLHHHHHHHLHQQQLAAAAAAANLHHGLHHHLIQQVGRTMPGPSSLDSPPPPAAAPPAAVLLPPAVSSVSAPSSSSSPPPEPPAPVKMIETWVLIPPELSLVSLQEQVRVYTRVPVAQGRRWSPFQGTVRLGVIPASSADDSNEMRYHSSGCYEEVTEVAASGHAGTNTPTTPSATTTTRKVRHCNWVRFLRPSPLFTPHVNVVCSKIKGEPVYEAVRPIGANTELVVFYLPGLHDEEEEMLYGGLPAVRSLRSSLFRRTMGLILQDSPLDLSLSLVTSTSGKGSPDPVGSGPSSPLLLPHQQSVGQQQQQSQQPASTSSRGHGGASDGRLSVSSDGLSTTGGLSSGREDENASTSGLDASSEALMSLAHHHHHLPTLPTAAAASIGLIKSRSSTSSSAGRPARQRPLLPCQVCGKAFDRPSLLNRHMRTHTGEKPHVCDVCGKGFSTSSSLNTHRRIHSGEKPHQCPVCGKRFTASSNLYYHRMTHIKEKPHKCALCSKSFPTPGDLKSHMYVHSGSWPFKCHVCSRGFSKHTNLKNHLFLHTGDKPHACELCNKRFALACNLRAHMKTHEGEPQEECARCGKTFLMPANASGGDVTGLCSDCCGDVKDGTDTEMEADDSADGDVDVDIHDQD